MTILRYYLPSANTFTFNFTSHISFHGSFSLLLLLFQIHSNPLIFSRSKIIFDPPSYIVRKISLSSSFPFPCIEEEIYPNRSRQTIARNITKKTCSTNDVDSSRCSPKSFLLPTQYHPPFSRWTFADSRLVRAGNSLALTFNRHLTFSLLRVSGDGGNDEEREMKRERERERECNPRLSIRAEREAGLSLLELSSSRFLNVFRWGWARSRKGQTGLRLGI